MGWQLGLIWRFCLEVRRFDSAPASPLPYGSDADARAPPLDPALAVDLWFSDFSLGSSLGRSSPPPPGALPLGLYIPEIPEVKPGPEGAFFELPRFRYLWISLCKLLSGADGGSIKGNAVEVPRPCTAPRQSSCLLAMSQDTADQLATRAPRQSSKVTSATCAGFAK